MSPLKPVPNTLTEELLFWRYAEIVICKLLQGDSSQIICDLYLEIMSKSIKLQAYLRQDWVICTHLQNKTKNIYKMATTTEDHKAVKLTWIFPGAPLTFFNKVSVKKFTYMWNSSTVHQNCWFLLPPVHSSLKYVTFSFLFQAAVLFLCFLYTSPVTSPLLYLLYVILWRWIFFQNMHHGTLKSQANHHDCCWWSGVPFVPRHLQTSWCCSGVRTHCEWPNVKRWQWTGEIITIKFYKFFKAVKWTVINAPSNNKMVWMTAISVNVTTSTVYWCIASK